MRALRSDSAVALGSRSTGLGTMVQEPRAGFHVAKWGVFCYHESRQSSLLCLQLVSSDTDNKKTASHEPKNYFVGSLPVFANKNPYLLYGQYF